MPFQGSCKERNSSECLLSRHHLRYLFERLFSPLWGKALLLKPRMTLDLRLSSHSLPCSGTLGTLYHLEHKIWGWTQVIRLACRRLYPQSHLIPLILFLSLLQLRKLRHRETIPLCQRLAEVAYTNQVLITPPSFPLASGLWAGFFVVTKVVTSSSCPRA